MSAEIGAAAGTATPWGAIAGTAIGLGSSLLQASQQSAEARYQQNLQNKAIEDAKRLAGANFMENIGVPLQGQMEAMRQNTAAYKQALEAGAEGDVRNLQGLVGRVNESVVDANAKQANEIDNRLYNLSVAQAQEQKGSANALAGVALNEAEGAGLAKQQAQKAQVGAYTNALQGVAGLGALYDKSRALYPNQGTITPQNVNANTQQPVNNVVQPVYNTGSNNLFGYGAQAETAPSAYNWSLLFK
jgi:hypothetical protein